MGQGDQKLTFIREEKETQGSYDIRNRYYECPCGKGEILHSKERPNGTGFGYQAIFSDILSICKDCDKKYNFKFGVSGIEFEKKHE